MTLEISNKKFLQMTNFGYLIKMSEFSDEILNDIKSDLKVKPDINIVYNKKKIDSFIVYQIGQSKMLLPKYYGIDKLGFPNDINTSISEYDNKQINFKFNGELRDYQVKIIDKCKNHYFDSNGNLLPFGGGTICIPPGKGKTSLGLYLGCLIKLPILIIVHKNRLISQWIKRIKDFIPNEPIGIIQQNVIDIEGKNIVIGMLQSICLKNYDEDIFEKFSFVIFDEVHHLGANKFSRALLKIQAPYTLGLSATPQRTDKLEKVFYWHLGPLIWEEYAEIDSTVKINLYKYDTSVSNKLLKPIFNFKTKQLNMAKMMTNLTELEMRNKFIVNLIVTDIFPVIPIKSYNINIHKISKKLLLSKNNLFLHIHTIDSNLPPSSFRKLLILSNRIEHLKKIEIMLISINPIWKQLIGYIIGGMKEHKLDESELKPIILATYEMASEGLDIVDLDTLILATPKSNITQPIGRILRLQKHRRKFTPTVYDIVDNVNIYLSQGKKRYSDYITKEYTTSWFNVCDTTITNIIDPFLKINYIDSNIDQFID